MNAPMHSLKRALPFWASLGLVPTIALAAMNGGWTLLAVPLYTWLLFTILDAFSGVDTSNPDISTPDHDLFWYRLITLIWPPIQAITLFVALAHIANTDHLATWEKLGVGYGLGILAGTIGIVYAHELMHQKPANCFLMPARCPQHLKEELKLQRSPLQVKHQQCLDEYGQTLLLLPLLRQ